MVLIDLFDLINSNRISIIIISRLRSEHTGKAAFLTFKSSFICYTVIIVVIISKETKFYDFSFHVSMSVIFSILVKKLIIHRSTSKIHKIKYIRMCNLHLYI